MKSNYWCYFLFITAQFTQKSRCLQTGLKISQFSKMGTDAQRLGQQTGIFAAEQTRVSSGANCAANCAEVDWCSGYVACSVRASPVCVLLHVNSSEQTTQNYSQYASCPLYAPPGFQPVNRSMQLFPFKS